MPEKSSTPLDIEPWFEGSEAEQHTVTVNVLLWLIGPLMFSVSLWAGLYVLSLSVNPESNFFVRLVMRVFIQPLGPFLIFLFLAVPYFLLHNYQLNRLSARLRGFLLGAFPSRAPLVFFHTLFCAAIAAAMIFLGRYLFDLGGVFDTVADNWRSPWVLLKLAFAYIQEGSWTRLFALSYFYLLLFWLVEEIVFALRFEINSARVEKVESFQAPRAAVPFASVAHLTDLHVTAGDETLRVDGGPGGNVQLRRALEELAGQSPGEVNAVLITGDVTDAGTADEWRRFFEIVPAELLEKCVLVPGNHELNIPQGKGLRAAIEPHEQIERKVRAIRFVAATDRVQGARTFVLESKPNGGLRPLRDYLADKEEDLKNFIKLARLDRHTRTVTDGWGKVEHVPYRVWDEIFPMVVESPGSELRVLVLNSNDEGLDLLTNAYGLIGRSQLKRLRLMLPQLSGKPFVVAMHHHLGVQRVGKTFKDRVFERAMPLMDGGALVKALAGEGRVVFNGHRHVSYFARIGDHIQIIAAPSTTLGDESGRRPRGELGFGIYQLAWDAREGMRVLSERWCRLA